MNIGNGGRLQARNASSNFLSGLDTFNIKDGGAVIDTQGNAITVTNSILNFAGATTASLSKTGSGTLTLTGANTYAGGTVVEGGLIIYDSTLIAEPGPLPAGRRVLPVPLSRLASDLGRPVVKNIVALGALQAASELLPASALLETLRHVLKDKAALLPLNEAAFAAGQQAVTPAPV